MTLSQSSKICEIDGCTNLARSHHMCPKHYQKSKSNIYLEAALSYCGKESEGKGKGYSGAYAIATSKHSIFAIDHGIRMPE